MSERKIGKEIDDDGADSHHPSGSSEQSICDLASSEEDCSMKLVNASWWRVWIASLTRSGWGKWGSLA